MQVQRKVASIISSAYPGFCSGLTNIAKHWFLIFIFIKSWATVTGGRNYNATAAQNTFRCRHFPTSMHPKYFIILLSLILLNHLSFGQYNTISKINTSAGEQYFNIVDILQANKVPVASDWETLFKKTVYQMMISGNAIDTLELKSSMIKVFMPSSIPLSISDLSSKERYHLAYKTNQTQLKVYIDFLKITNVIDSVKALLYPFLPKHFQTTALFPTLFYLNYGSAEATGYGGVVINDLLHSYKIDKYKFGLLAAHEAFHSIVSVGFQKALKQDINYNAPDFNLLYFLQNMSEEGIADLIDKPLLSQKSSPVYDEVKVLVENDELLSIMYIEKLDSLLKLASTSEQTLNQYQSFTILAKAYGQNGGHIPGRFIGWVINEGGLLKRHILSVEDPVSFIITYNDAVKTLGNKYPVFSKESIAYLIELKTRYWQTIK